MKDFLMFSGVEKGCIGIKWVNIALKCKFKNLSGSTYNEFERAFYSVLNKHAPIKVNMLRHNTKSFMRKK